MIPTAYGISFGIRFLNQGGALVHIYTDGSVLLNHGGVEMGQGLHTKMIQVKPPNRTTTASDNRGNQQKINKNEMRIEHTMYLYIE